MERCPNCRARSEGADTCRRCGMDLAALLAAESAAETLCRRALGELADDDPGAAVATLAQARTLVGDPLIARLLGFARHLADAGEPEAGAPDAGEPDAGEPEAVEPGPGEPGARIVAFPG